MDNHELIWGLLAGIPSLLFVGCAVVMVCAYIYDGIKKRDK